MSKFAHLKGQRLTKDTTREFTLHQIEVNGVSPTLVVSPATEVNKAYFNALLKRSARTARRAAQGKVDAGMIAENREEDRKLYPLHVVRGWKDVIGADGQPVDFNREDCEDFLRAIDDWIFDDLRNFCTKPENFAEDAVDADVVEDASGN